jgi:hypothetical protein
MTTSHLYSLAPGQRKPGTLLTEDIFLNKEFEYPGVCRKTSLRVEAHMHFLLPASSDLGAPTTSSWVGVINCDVLLAGTLFNQRGEPVTLRGKGKGKGKEKGKLRFHYGAEVRLQSSVPRGSLLTDVAPGAR